MVFLAISFNAYASCLEVIRDRLAIEESKIEEFHSVLRNLRYKEYKLESSLSINIPSQKKSLKKEFIEEYLKSFENDLQQKQLIEHLPTIYSTPDTIRDWVRGLAKDIVRETYREKDKTLIEQLSLTGEISQTILLKVLQRRLNKAGFDKSKLSILKGELSPTDFAKILESRSLILDEGFAQSDHGVFVHILQLDLIRYSATKEGIHPGTVGAFYEWMGENETIYLPKNDTTFSPLFNLWDVYFDSFTWDITSPEIFNPIIEEFIGLKIKETPRGFK
jgi:hypothetical protein